MPKRVSAFVTRVAIKSGIDMVESETDLENIKDEKNNILFINYQFKQEPYIEEVKTFFKGKIIVITPNIVYDIQDEYYTTSFRYKLENNYVYFINF